MASRYITTSGEFNQLIPTYSNGDDVYIQDGASATMAHSPNFRIDNLIIQDGEVIMDGASGTAPIQLASTNWAYFYPGTTFRTTEGWTTFGTSDGSPSQIIDTTNICTDGGANSDVLYTLTGIQANMGWTYRFTEGTGTLPVTGQWLQKFDDPYNHYGYIYDSGTTAGTGFITTQYTIGTMSNLDKLCSVDIIERGGPSLERFWQGTTGEPELATDVWQNMYNCAALGTNYKYKMSVNTPGGLGYCHQGGTNLELGDGVWGIIPPNGSALRVPNNIINYVGSTDYTNGTSSQTSTSTWNSIYTLHTLDLNAVNIRGYQIQGAGPISLDLDYVFEDYKLFCTSPNASSIYINNCMFTGCRSYGGLDIYGFAGDDIYIEDNILTGFFYNTSTTCLKLDNVHPIGKVYVSDNILNGPIINRPFYSNNFKNSSNIQLDNNIVIGNFTLETVSNLELLRTKITTNHEGGLPAYKYTNITGIYLLGDFTIKGWEFLAGYIPAQGITDISNSTLDTFKLRCIGSPHYPLYVDSNSTRQYFFDLLNRKAELDAARIYMDTSVATYSKYVIETYTTDGSTLFQNIIFPQSIGLTHFFNTPNHSMRGMTWYPTEPGNAMQSGMITSMKTGNNWSDMYRQTGYGQITSLLIEESSSYNSYTLIAGSIIRTNQNEITLTAGSVLETEMDYFALGHTGFTGTTAELLDAGDIAWETTGWGGSGTTSFQYDTGGTGFNGTWQDVYAAGNWTGLDVVDGTGVKLKFQYGATTDVTGMAGFAVQTTSSDACQTSILNMHPIDQTITTITLSNVVVDSRYYIYDSTSMELLSSGIATSSTVTHEEANLADATQLLIRVRKSSGGTKYQPYETQATTASLVANIFVSQIEDTIVS